MTSIERAIGALIVACVVSGASAQTQAPYTHPGKVQIRSTATDALVVLGGITGTAVKASVVDAGVGTVPIVATFERTGATGSSTSRGVAIAFGDSSNPTLTAAIVGLRPGSNANYNGDLAFFVATGGAASPATSVTANMTRRLTIKSNGQILAESNGTVSAPAIAFGLEPTSGLFRSTTASFSAAVGGIEAARFDQGGISVPAEARGTGGVAGKAVVIGRNTSGNGAPGQIALEARNGAGAGFLWVDTTGLLRIGTAYVTEAGGDTGGTIVGTQTSTRASKHVIGEVTDTAAAMALIRGTPVYRFTYRSGAYRGETFVGITTDDSPLFGMDAGKSFNPVTAFGVSVLALRDLDARVRALEGRR